MASPLFVIVVGGGFRVHSLVGKAAPGAMQVVAVVDDWCGPADRWPGAARYDFAGLEDAMAAHREARAVMIGSINCLHVEHAQRVLAAPDTRLRAIFVEKPLATTHDGLDVLGFLAKNARTRGIEFFCGFVLRHAPFYVAMRREMEALGKPVSIVMEESITPDHGAFIQKGWRRSTAASGGHLLEKCCHDVDVMLWLVGSPVTHSASFGGRSIFVPGNLPAPADFSGRMVSRCFGDERARDPFNTPDADINDHQSLAVEFAGGCTGTVSVTSASWLPRRSVTVNLTRGTVSGDLLEGRFTVAGAGVPRRVVDVGTSGMHGGGDGLIMAAFIDTAVNGTPPFPTFDDAIRSCKTTILMDKSHGERFTPAIMPQPTSK